ncbi:MAG: glycosyltransferase [Rhodobacteraceae bacterium]|nr:glycosyltransferase [Paracoccaceae bacterium]
MDFFTDKNSRILVIAPLPPVNFSAAKQAAEVVHCLIASGRHVHTASAVPPSYCSEALHFTPKRRFDPILQGLLTTQHDLTLLYPQGLGFDLIRQTSWKNRRKEEIRRLKLIGHLVFRKPKIVVAYPTMPTGVVKFACLVMILSARLLRPRSVRLVLKKHRGIELARRILGQETAAPDPASAEETVFQLADSQDRIRLTPTWLRRAVHTLPTDDPLRHELKTLYAVSEIITQLAPLPFQETLAQTVTGDIPDEIDDPFAAIPLSNFMLHLRYKFRMEGEYPLSQTAERVKFLRWYFTSASVLTNHPMPLPDTVFEAFKNDCKTRAQLLGVAALPKPDTRNVILPAYLLALHRCHPKKFNGYKLATNNGRIAFAFQAVVMHARFDIDDRFLGQSISTYFTTPVGGIAGNITRFELIGAVVSHAPVHERASLKTPWKSPALADWFDTLSKTGFPLLKAFRSGRSVHPQKNITVTGTGGFDTGLGQNQRMSMTVIKNLRTNRPVFVHHANADEIPTQICRHSADGAFHIGYLLWELENLPNAHTLANRMLDDIWVPSKFVQKSYETAFRRPVTMIGKGFDLPDVPAMDLSDYGISPSNIVFLSCFDMHSSVARKNPLAAVRGFQQAFPRDKNMRFILKTTPPPQSHWGDPEGQMAKISQIAAKDSRIIIDQRMLPFSDLLSLIRAVDCVVSSHRAEGFGYLPAYALKYAKPVIVTDYSGTQDFCNAETAFPVKFRFQPVKPNEIILPVQKTSWAEIDVTDLSRTMREVADDLTGANLRGADGQALMLDFYSRAALATRYQNRLDSLGLLDGSLTKRSLNVRVQNGQPIPGTKPSARHMSPITKP